MKRIVNENADGSITTYLIGARRVQLISKVKPDTQKQCNKFKYIREAILRHLG